jgi:hypothetical protein
MSDELPNWKREAAAALSQRRAKVLADRRAEDEAHKLKMRRFDDELTEISISARTMELPVPWLESALKANVSPTTASFESVGLPSPPPSRKPFKDRALELLRDAYPAPLKAAQIQARIEKEHGSKYHDKTAGMSLYRLSKDNSVRREGKDLWFFVPEDQRNKENPGSGSEPEDPGSLL